MSFFLPKAALDQHVAILGKTGSGKTWTAKLVVEHVVHQKRQVCILDPTGAWFGLRLDANGKSKGLDIVLLGGEHADIPLAERSGSAVARLVTEQGASVVIDTSGFTVGEYTRWFIDFAGTLYTTLRSPLHLVVDEAHYFMPQGKSPDIDAGKMLHAGNRLMSGGRSRGIRGMLITQRPAKLHKDALTCADTLIAMRVIAPQDRKAIKDWVDGCGNAEDGKQVLESLAQLKRGEGWVWYPEGGHLERVTFPPITTYDSSAAPKHGVGSGPEVAAIDLTEVRTALASAVAEAEANDPKLLRKQLAELQKQLKARPAETKVETKVERVEVPVLKNGQLDKAWKLVERMHGLMNDAREIYSPLANAVARVTAQPATPAAGVKPAAPKRECTNVTPTVTRRNPSENVPTGDLTARQQRFLDAAVTLTTLNSEVTRETVSAWVGVHPRGGSVGEELKALEEAGKIVVDRGRINVTESGMASATCMDASEAIERAKSGLSDRQRRFFDAIVGVYPESISREQIAEQFQLHPRGGSLGEDLGRLVGRGLVEGRRGAYRARDFLFATAR